MQQLDNVLWAISIHALREEGDMPILRACLVRCLFLSTPSARRATRAVMETAQAIKNFYPRPPRGGRLAYRLRAQMFLSISIHALREEGDEDAHGNYMTEQISIHALREEGDPVIPLKLCGLVEISIHALREEGDVVPLDAQPVYLLFLSTPSARRATLPLFRASENSDFYPRPPRGGRLHTRKSMSWSCDFYPRPPRGGRRGCFFSWRRCPTISIHALREEGDQVCHAGRSKQHNFYPRPPRGGRPGSLLRRYKHEYFYPRPPRGGRPLALSLEPCDQLISIHALREEGDPANRRRHCHKHPISIHALREEGDAEFCRAGKSYGISIHALREEGDDGKSRRCSHQGISIHALREEGDPADLHG